MPGSTVEASEERSEEQTREVGLVWPDQPLGDYHAGPLERVGQRLLLVGILEVEVNGRRGGAWPIVRRCVMVMCRFQIFIFPARMKYSVISTPFAKHF